MTIMPAFFSEPRRSLVIHCANQLQGHFRQLQMVVGARLGRFSDPKGFEKRLEGLMNDQVVLQGNPEAPIRDENFPMLKLALLQARRMAAINVETQQAATHHLETLGELDQVMVSYNQLMDEEWCKGVEAAAMPQLSDYLTIKVTEEMMNEHQLPARQYDEKFGVLQASNLFLPDLRYFRARCALRHAPVSTAYLDIDEFKSFNTQYREAVVDRALLPKFMETIESHIFMHGHAYRYGGDEYMLLLPNMPLGPAVDFINRLREKLRNVDYQGISKNPTISVGLCVVGVDSYLTDREVEDRANRAKTYAKNEGGKDCIATYAEGRFGDNDLYKVESAASTGRHVEDER
jgi:diguanylate cyclase (GGDEF)-like protein